MATRQVKAVKDPKGSREKTKQNQAEFWNPVGVTQSGGSRYESGRGIPMAVAILLALREQGLISDDQLYDIQKQVKASRR